MEIDGYELLKSLGESYYMHKALQKTAAEAIESVSYLEAMGVFNENEEPIQLSESE